MLLDVQPFKVKVPPVDVFEVRDNQVAAGVAVIVATRPKFWEAVVWVNVKMEAG